MIKPMMTKFIVGLFCIGPVLHAQFALPVFQAVNSQDNNGPRITITATDGSNSVSSGSLTNDATLTITFTADEVITGFAVGDVATIRGGLSSFSGSGRTYTATFTPSYSITTAIYIVANGYVDQVSNNNLPSIPFYWTYDGVAPIYILGTYITPDNSQVKIRLSELVYDTGSGSGALETGDFTFSISGGTATLGSSNPTSITKDTPTFSSATIDSDLNGAFGVIIKDLDFDGDMDIIATGLDGDDVNWYENDGSENFTERSIDGNLDGALGLVVNDMDGDGDMDVFATAFAGDDVVWYENDGSQSFTKTVIDANLTTTYGLDVQDLDSDGDMDVIATGRGINDVVWYENNGAESFTEKTIDADLDGAGRLVVRDLDEDGDMDVIVTALDANDVVWYANNGSESFTKSIIDDDLENARHVVVHDLDDDGDLDVIATSSDASGDDLVWYANDGSENFTASAIANDLSEAFDLEVADLDGDNDQDVIVTVFTDNDVLWYANNGSEIFTKNTIDNNFGGVAELAVEDLDSDGDMDVVVTARTADDIKFYANSDSGYVLGISLSGTANGSETLTISPTNSSIYDAAGNTASTSQSYSTVTVNDKTGPTMTITASNGMVIINDGSTTNNSTLSLTFTSSETTTNFAVGDVTVSGGSLSSFSGSGTTYTATFTPSASGATTIDVSGSTFTDAAGNNNSAASQFNWTYDGTLPTVTGVSLASDNSTIAVTFSEAVYNTAGGSGSLETSDFVLSISGGSATLSSSTPSSISASSNTYTLGISLSGTANGSETLTVNPASSAIFDVVGNTASTSQSNNTASLNSANYVLDLDGSNEAAYVGDNSAFESTDFSIQVWVDPSSLPSSGNEAWFVNKNRVYRIGLKNNSGTTKIIAEHRSGGSYEDIEGSTLSDANGGWYHVVFTFDDSSNRLRIYVNGSEIDEESYGGSTVNQNSEFSIGRRHDTNGGYFHGKIDEVAYWDTELSANAISALYNSGSPLSASTNSGNYSSSANLVMYYQFQGDLDDSEGSFNLTGRNITSSDYTAETID